MAKKEQPAAKGTPRDLSFTMKVWGKEGPEGAPANIRLAHTAPESFERALYGEWFPARAFVRQGGVRFELPTLADGQPDEALQRAGFYHEGAARIASRFPDYKLIQPKG